MSVFGKRLSRKSNNVVVLPFAFHITVQQPFKPLWSCLLLYDLEPSQASFALCFKSLLMMLCPASEEFYQSYLLLGISLHLAPNLLTCPAWETLLVAMLPPVYLSGLLELKTPPPRQGGDTIRGEYVICKG
jgi:hypothetical protein